MAATSPETFIKIEQAYVAAMLPTMRKELRQWSRRVGRLVESGDLDGARAESTSLDVGEVYTKHRKRMAVLSESSLMFGAGQLTSKTSLIGTSADETMTASQNLLEKMVRKYDQWGSKLMLRLIDLYEEEDRKKSESILRDFVSFSLKKQETLAESHLQMVSGLHNSRLAAYGFAQEATVRGIEFYSLNAILDDRTSEICRTLHGKVFPVDRALTFTQDLLHLDDPEELKERAPWPTKEPNLAQMTAEELMDRGYYVPPFHPNCRTYLDRVQGLTPLDAGQASVDKPRSVADTVTERPSITPELLNHLSQNKPQGVTEEDRIMELGLRGYISDRADRIGSNIDLTSLGTAAIVGLLVVGVFDDTNLASDEVQDVLDDLDAGLEENEILSRYAISRAELDYIKESYELYG